MLPVPIAPPLLRKPLKGFDDIIPCLQFAMDEKFLTPQGYESLSSSDGSGLD